METVFVFYFLSKKSFVRKINANRKCFFKKEIGCREIALTLLFLELRVHILRWCRYGAEAHESGMYHFIFLSMGDPTTRSTGKIVYTDITIANSIWTLRDWRCSYLKRLFLCRSGACLNQKTLKK